MGLIVPIFMGPMFSADCVEYGTYITGKRSEAITFSIQTFSTKLGTAFGGSVAIWFIALFGYNGLVETQTPQALNGIWIANSLVPAIGALIALIIFALFYKLDEKEVADMMQEIKNRAGSSSTEKG